jgi:hypothetical protein
VVPHPAGDKDVSASDTLHAVLFDSAKPVLIAHRTAPSTIGHHICIGWNGTAESASAVMTALPWLQRAESIRILWSQDYQRRGPLAPDLEQYLAAHHLTVDRAAFQSINKMAGAGLLAAANEFACDLQVMGPIRIHVCANRSWAALRAMCSSTPLSRCLCTGSMVPDWRAVECCPGDVPLRQLDTLRGGCAFQ